MKKKLPQLAKHGLVILGFMLVAVLYFSPVLSNKIIYQSDIAQYIGMSKQHKDFKAETGEESYWTDAAFGGMPTYQLGADYPYHFIKSIDRGLRFLPRPADYLFLYFIGIYILFLTLKVDYRLAILGSLAFGFSTYLIIILGVGHNAKAHAIAYFPLVISGILLLFQKRKILGFITLFLGMSLELVANHFQMTYYLFLLVLVIGIVYLVDAYKKKELKQYFSAIGLMLIPVLLAIGVNSTNILATQEYTEFSTRGDTGLTINPNGSPKASSALSYEYITEYSYGILESFNLFIPRFMGGSSSETLDSTSESYKELLQLGASPQQALGFVKNAPTYWGDQTFIGAPAYIGASLVFLFVLALFLVNSKTKKWIIGGVILSLVLSWGDNFAFVTKFFINYVPLYDKFRAVSSIQTIIEFVVPVLGVVGLAAFFNSQKSKKEKEKALYYSAGILGGLALIFILFKNVLFDFSSPRDAHFIQEFGAKFVRALKIDRQDMLVSDALRSLAIVLVAAGILWLYLQDKVKKNLVILGLGILVLVDLIPINRNYVNEDDFVAQVQMKEPFQAQAYDLEIMKDQSHYRVLDVSQSRSNSIRAALNSARASYFHNSIGGYHAAKPGRVQDLFDFDAFKRNQDVLNMLNVKYLIVNAEDGVRVQQNESAFGNAWFAEKVNFVKNANESIKSLDTVDLARTAVIESKYKKHISKENYQPQFGDQIELTNYTLNELTYEYKLNSKRLAIFSELYYSKGWQAYLDGEKVDHFAVDYVLRGLELPEGEHQITFKFEPQVISRGNTITLASYGIFILLLAGLFFQRKKRTD